MQNATEVRGNFASVNIPLTPISGVDEPATSRDADSSAVILRNQEGTLSKMDDSAAGSQHLFRQYKRCLLIASFSSISSDADVPWTRDSGW